MMFMLFKAKTFINVVIKMKRKIRNTVLMILSYVFFLDGVYIAVTSMELSGTQKLFALGSIPFFYLSKKTSDLFFNDKY